jgi:hypothetical protein
VYSPLSERQHFKFNFDVQALAHLDFFVASAGVFRASKSAKSFKISGLNLLQRFIKSAAIYTGNAHLYKSYTLDRDFVRRFL